MNFVIYCEDYNTKNMILKSKILNIEEDEYKGDIISINNINNKISIYYKDKIIFETSDSYLKIFCLFTAN